MIILAIETSCDETAIAIVRFSKNKAEVLANVVSSQIKTHSKFGGVVPSLASRMHLKNIVPVLKRAFKSAKINKSKISYIAVTNGPGLIPALMIGTQAAKTLAYALNKPLIPIHHIEGHIYANWLKGKSEIRNWKFENKKQKSENSEFQVSSFKFQNYELWTPAFPVLCLIVSGGHTQLILMKKDLDYKIIGETLDDAAGEAFDKVAKLLGLGYPGGPIIEKIARLGDGNKFKFPRPMINSKDYNFSFSGLKTAVLYNYQLQITNYQLQYKADVAASFQQAVIDVLISKTIRAAKEYKAKNIILGGGVAANKELRKQLCEAINEKFPIPDQSRGQVSKLVLERHRGFQIPNLSSRGIGDSNLSTDNALMIAVAGYYHILNNRNISNWRNVEADANFVLSRGC